MKLEDKIFTILVIFILGTLYISALLADMNGRDSTYLVYGCIVIYGVPALALLISSFYVFGIKDKNNKGGPNE